jgi:predicted transcriptional regulator
MTSVSSRTELIRMLTGKWIPPVVAVLADLGIADQLRDGPLSADELAKRVGAHPGALHRVLRAAVSVGLFTADGDGRYGLNEMAEWLRSDIPDSLRAAGIMFGLEPFWTPYARI